MFRKHIRFRRRLFVGLAFAALAAPTAAQAQTGLMVDGGPVGTTHVSSYVARSEHSATVGAPTELQRFLAFAKATRQQPTITPLQADGLRWQAMGRFYQAQQANQAISERSNGVKGPDPSLVPQVVLSTSSGFDWKDAGIGASTALATALLLGIALVLTRRHQHTGLTSA
jgi:hypothetical protein